MCIECPCYTYHVKTQVRGIYSCVACMCACDVSIYSYMWVGAHNIIYKHVTATHVWGVLKLILPVFPLPEYNRATEKSLERLLRITPMAPHFEEVLVTSALFLLRAIWVTTIKQGTKEPLWMKRQGDGLQNFTPYSTYLFLHTRRHKHRAVETDIWGVDATEMHQERKAIINSAPNYTSQAAVWWTKFLKYVKLCIITLTVY